MPLLWLCIAFVSGIWLGSAVSWSPWAWAGWLGAAALIWLLPFLLRRSIIERPGLIRAGVNRLSPPRLQSVLRPVNRLRRLKLGIGLPWLVLAIYLGIARFQAVQPVFIPGSLVEYYDVSGSISVEGIMVEPADERDGYTNLVLQVVRVRLPGDDNFQASSGLLLARLQPGETWRYGDQVRLGGILLTPSEDELFSYRAYLAQRGIYSLMYASWADRLGSARMNPVLAALYALRSHSQEVLYRLYPDPEASLLAGILLGLERGLPPQVSQAFQATGTAHIIAISGFNMSLLSGLCAAAFARTLGRRRGALAALAAITLYTLLVGAQAAVVRAAIMSGMAVFAAQIGRRQHGLNSLAFTGAVMAAIHPYVLWDVGFQLSAAATLGLVLFGVSWPKAFERLAARWLNPSVARQVAGVVGEYVLLTLAAQLMTLPVIVYHFHRFSLAALVANPVVLPVQPALMVLGGLSLLAGLVWLPAGQLLAFIAWPFAAFTIRAVETFASLPGAEWSLAPVSLGWVVVFYAVLLTWRPVSAGLSRWGIRLTPLAGLVCLAVLTIQVWRLAWAAPDGRLHLVLLNETLNGRSGETLFIVTAQGRNILINGGPSVNRLADSLGRRLGAGGIDCLIVSTSEEDDIRALPEMVGRYPPASVLWAGDEQTSWSAQRLHSTLVDAGVEITPAQAGMALDLGEGAVLKVLEIEKGGMVLLLEWQRFRSLLLLGDGIELNQLVDQTGISPITALYLPYWKAETGNSVQWFTRLKPQIILMNTLSMDPGYQNETLKGATLLSTDRNGWIELSTDGEQVWVEVEGKE